MKRKSYFLLGFVFSFLTYGQSFTTFIAEVQSAPDSLKLSKVDSFLVQLPNIPYTENDTLVHFIYTGSVNTVHIAGDQTGWSPNLSMVRLSGTNMWYRSEIYASEARLDYKFVLNSSNWVLDPRNPFTISGGFGPNSELRMPNYIPPEEITYNPNIPHGMVTDTTIFSANLNNIRRVYIYTPPDYDTGADYGFALFNDGPDYLTLANAQNILDNLIYEGKIKPIVGLFIPAVNRRAEYATTDQQEFTNFIVEDVMPWMNSRYKINDVAGTHAVIGSSDGGNISLWLGANHPEIFGNVGAQSSNVEQNVHDLFNTSEKKNLKLYLDVGLYDHPVIIPRAKNLIPVLEDKNYDFNFTEYPEGHSWGFWRAHLDDMLIYFFSPSLSSAEINELPYNFELRQNYPNPFNPTTIVEYVLTKDTHVEMNVTNTLGERVINVFSEYQLAGNHTLKLDLHNYSSGIYFVNLSTREKSKYIKVVLQK